MNLFKQGHEKGILIKTYEFEDCPFIEFKLRYYLDQFVLWRYIPKADEWKKVQWIEVFLIKKSPEEWAEDYINQYRGIDDSTGQKD